MSEMTKTAPVADAGHIVGEEEHLTQGHDTTTDGNEMRPEVTKFISSAPGTESFMPPAPDTSFLPKHQEDGDLAGFLRRPIRIYTLLFENATAHNYHIDPWAIFLNNPAIQNKLANFRFLRGTLHLSITLNGTPFNYGRFMVSYEPRNGARPLIGMTDNSLDGDYRQHSNLPHVLLDPSRNAVGELVCPFISPYQWIDLTSTSGTQLGILNVDTIAQLASASGVINDVGGAVFGWLEDVEIAYPTRTATAAFVPQAGDEYEVSEPNAGVISTPMDKVAEFAGWLGEAPVIGKFARATEMVMKGGAAIARFFGYSRPRVLKADQPYLQSAVGNLVSTDTADSSYAFTMNSKSELTIDPKTIGFGGDIDELSIAAFTRRWTIIPTVDTWEYDDAANSTIATWEVNPFVGSTYVVGTPDYHNLTAMSAAAFPFAAWRGGIEFEFTMVASRYHRGRFRLEWDADPNSGGPVTEELNTAYNRIFDLSDGEIIRMTIPYVSRYGYLNMNPVLQDAGSNGILRLKVVNPLQAPDPTAPVSVIVRVRGAEDLQFANPGTNISNLTAVFPQSAESSKELGDAAEVGIIDASPFLAPSDPRVNDIYFADPIRSFRALIKRYSFHGSFTSGNIVHANDTTEDVFFTLPAWPHALGSDNTLLTSGYIYETATVGYNTVATSVLTYLAPMFLAKRGGMRWFVEPTRGSNIDLDHQRESKIWVTRAYDEAQLKFEDLSSSITTENGGAVRTVLNAVPFQAVASGVQAFPNNPNARGIQYEMPYYNTVRYSKDVYPSTSQGDPDGCATTAVILLSSTNRSGAGGADGVRFDTYYAAAEDFTMMFFIGVPRMYVIDRTAQPYDGTAVGSGYVHSGVQRDNSVTALYD